MHVCGPTPCDTGHAVMAMSACAPWKFGVAWLSPPSVPTLPRDQTIVVASVFGELYSTNDGASFAGSTGGGTSQSVRFVGVNGDGGEKFGTA